MATTTITNLPDATLPLGGDERVPMVQAGVTVDAPASALAALATVSLSAVATSGLYGDLTGKPTLGTVASRDVPATGDASATQVVLGGDSRLSNSRTPTAHTQAWSTITGTPTSVAGYGITDALSTDAAASTYQPLSANLTALGANSAAYYLSRANHTGTQSANTITGLATVATTGAYGDLSGRPTEFDPAAPGPIGGTTAAAGSFTALGASSSLLLPAASPGTPAAGNVYRVANQLRYRDSTATEQVLLYGAGNLANLTDAATARTNLGLGTLAVAAAGGGLSIQSGTLVPIDHIALVCTNNDETGTTGSNRAEKRIHRAFTVIGCYWECATTGSTSSQAMPYLRPSSTGTKASLLTGNAVLAALAGYIDVSANLTGTLTGVAGDSVGVDLNAVGTGAKGHILTIVVRYS